MLADLLAWWPLGLLAVWLLLAWLCAIPLTRATGRPAPARDAEIIDLDDERDRRAS